MKQIKNFPNYKITQEGRVWSIKNKKWLTPRHNHGYLRVWLCKNGTVTDKLIHRLVLETFVGPCPEGMECCHNDGNPQNNCLENLRWDTRSNNSKDTIKHGRSGILKVHQKSLVTGIKNHNAKLNPAQIKLIFNSYHDGLYSLRELANTFNVCKSTIRSIVTQQTWKQVTQVCPYYKGD